MAHLWGIEKDETGKYATNCYGPLGPHQRAVLDAWIAETPAGRSRCEVDAAMGEWVRDEREKWGGKALLSNYPEPN